MEEKGEDFKGITACKRKLVQYFSSDIQNLNGEKVPRKPKGQNVS
jgi:hypothetical protein